MHRQGRAREAQGAGRGNALTELFGGFPVTYVLSEFVLATRIHAIHWRRAAVGTLLVYLVSYIWLLRREYTSRSNVVPKILRAMRASRYCLA